MKKFFLFAAAAIAAMTVNAKVYNFAGITAEQISTDGTIGTYVMDEVEIPSVSQPDGVDINVTLDGQEGLVINYTQSAGKSKDNILKFAADFMQADGKNVILTFSDVNVGDQIKLVVSAKGSTNAQFNALDGASGDDQTVAKINKVEDFATVIFTATAGDVKIKEIGGGFRIVSATIEAAGDDPGDDPGDNPGDDPISGSFDGFDGRTGDLGAQIAGGLLANEVNVTLAETSTGKYSIRNTEAGEMSFTLGGVLFKGSDQQAGKDIYKTYNTYIQPNGARRSVVIPTAAGEKVLIGVQDAITFAVEGAAEGASISFQGWGDEKDVLNTLTATGSAIVLWSDDRAESPAQQKFKLGVILPGGGTQGVENVFEAEKAVKFIHNGQVVVKKGNRFFNILGAEITL